MVFKCLFKTNMNVIIFARKKKKTFFVAKTEKVPKEIPINKECCNFASGYMY